MVFRFCRAADAFLFFEVFERHKSFMHSTRLGLAIQKLCFLHNEKVSVPFSRKNVVSLFLKAACCTPANELYLLLAQNEQQFFPEEEGSLPVQQFNVHVHPRFDLDQCPTYFADSRICL